MPYDEMTRPSANKVPHMAIRLMLGLCGIIAGFVSGALEAKEFRVTAIRDFEKIFSSVSGPDIEKAFRGAIVMRWDRKRFQGFSGLHINAGRRLTAISDRGSWLEITLISRDQFLVGARQPVMKRLRGPGGDKLKRKKGDAEALAPDGRGGYVIAFERRPRLLHYPAWRKPFSLAPAQIASPAGGAAFSTNRGVEALARLCNGQFLMIAQEAGGGKADAWLGGAKGWAARRYLRSDGYNPTGAVTLSDCSVAVLERRGKNGEDRSFRIRLLPASTFDKDGTGDMAPIPLFGPAFSPALNFEGITAFGESPGTVLFYLISDSSVRSGTTLASFAVRIREEMK
jgi:hypothetical protein